MQTIPGEHWYPESGSIEQNVSGMASEFIVKMLKFEMIRKDDMENNLNAVLKNPNVDS